jgi:hypothetical protein
MTIARGSLAYKIQRPPASGEGRSFLEGELRVALTGAVRARIQDQEGLTAVAELLESVATTQFDGSAIQRVSATTDRVENWRVGEGLAETYLQEHQNCEFPWPVGRDEKKSGSSLPGADLVGWQIQEDGEIRFAFGEVKTSTEARYPPGVLLGRSGLHQQLEDLRDRTDLRDGLMKYLAYRAWHQPWAPAFKRAASRYLRDDQDVALFGVLVRDVPADPRDVKSRLEALADGCSPSTPMAIQFLALYLPASSIANLAAMVLVEPEGGAS